MIKSRQDRLKIFYSSSFFLSQFRRFGGRVLFGAASSGSDRRSITSALFTRSRLLVNSCSVLVAFIYGESAGTWHTVKLAIDKGIPVFVFCLDGAMRDYIGGSWVTVCGSGIYSAAYKWVPTSQPIQLSLLC